MAKNGTVFVRPNLKGFLLGAVLLLVVQHLISSGHSEGHGPSRLLAVNARELSDGDIRELIRYSSAHPSAEIYSRISNAYERRGEYRKALLFLQRAEKISQLQELSE
jgi:hypothetical protein